MLELQKDISLKSYNTFGIDVKTAYLYTVEAEEDIYNILNREELSRLKWLVLGEGSNILFTADYPGLILHNAIKGIEKIEEDSIRVIIKVGAGEKWDDLVNYAIINGYGGIENLSLIPGTVGAAPVQNIGAYGMEVKETIQYIEGIHLEIKEKQSLTNNDCVFNYRDSIFKRQLKNKFFITYVYFRFNKKPILKYDYKEVQKRLEQYSEISLKSIREVVISIRREKLPDVNEIGNAGSFFKNPVIQKDKFNRLQKRYPDMPFFTQYQGTVKIPSAWLIEKTYGKGIRDGNCGNYTNQPLILVNYGVDNGYEIFRLAQKIRTLVKHKFDIDLEFEVNIQP